MSDFNRLEEKIDSLSKRNEWRIAVVSAIVAAIASIATALIAYASEGRQVRSSETIQNDQNSISVYKAFGDHVVKGTVSEKCIALLLITSANPQSGTKSKNQDMSKYIGCDRESENPSGVSYSQFYKSLDKDAGSACTRTRVTYSTQKRLFGAAKDEALRSCVDGIEVPERYDGPWDDGSVSFYLQATASREEIWCNCVPSPKES